MLAILMLPRTKIHSPPSSSVANSPPLQPFSRTKINATQIFLLGDNFYHSGIHTPADGINGEKRIKKTFEDVYTAQSLKDIPFWVIAGNHDHLGNVSSQIAYTNHPQNVGGRWKFPYWQVFGVI
jgi:hypothetical protein